MLYTAFILGLLGSFHCVGMCGPVAFLLPLDRKNRSKRILQLISYHVGRVFTYAVLGIIIGLLGKSLNFFGVQQHLSIAVGILMIVVILVPLKLFNRYNFSRPIYIAVGKLKKAIGVNLKKKNVGTFFTIGYLNGLLPCGLVYMAIFGALASGGALQGGAYMVFFGLGTIPLMTTAIYLGNFLKGKTKQRLKRAIPVFVVLLGLLFILRGLGLGIPYVSPADEVAIEKVSALQKCH